MSKERQALEKEVATALFAAGFSKIDKYKFKKVINSETWMFVYPGIRSGRSYLQIHPVVGIENLTLTTRLKALDKTQDARVCHILMGSIDGVISFWGGTFSLYAAKGDTTARMVQLFIDALERFALPKLAVYDSKEKVAELFKLYIASHTNVDVVISDAQEKLMLLTSH